MHARSRAPRARARVTARPSLSRAGPEAARRCLLVGPHHVVHEAEPDHGHCSGHEQHPLLLGRQWRCRRVPRVVSLRPRGKEWPAAAPVKSGLRHARLPPRPGRNAPLGTLLASRQRQPRPRRTPQPAPNIPPGPARPNCGRAPCPRCRLCRGLHRLRSLHDCDDCSLPQLGSSAWFQPDQFQRVVPASCGCGRESSREEFGGKVLFLPPLFRKNKPSGTFHVVLRRREGSLHHQASFGCEVKDAFARRADASRVGSRGPLVARRALPWPDALPPANSCSCSRASPTFSCPSLGF